MARGWIGVDLDGTLAEYDGRQGVNHIGMPVPAMLERVIAWLDEGQEVRIFTDRVCERPESDSVAEVAKARIAIRKWLHVHLPKRLALTALTLPITNVKDRGMIELWDDRVVQVEKNTGRRLVPEPTGEITP